MTAIFTFESKRSPWQTIATFALGFWLSGSLILDWVIMPSLYVSGMMAQTGFATVGYLVFWNFNRIELLAAALVLSSVLALNMRPTEVTRSPAAIVLSMVLLAISSIDTYYLTPQMCATGIHLNLFASATEIPTTMNWLHGGYLTLEVVKFVVGGVLLGWCVRREA
jgi:ABC-type uncharacterized transport system permease subunit